MILQCASRRPVGGRAAASRCCRSKAMTQFWHPTGFSGRFWFEGESGLAEESDDEAVLSLDAVQLVPHRGGELVCGAGGEVA